VKGDFTRETFRARRHYWGVLRQQGRVDVDADWNEQVRIARHHQVSRTRDLVGEAGGPQEGAGFELSVDSTGRLTIGAGRYYVAGVLCENEEEVAFASQPDADPTASLPGSAGLHLGYLDVWDRHITAHLDPPIRETALGGPDTATRGATVWQVRSAPLAGASAALTAAINALAAARAAGDPEAERQALQAIRNIARAALCAAPLDPLGGSLEPNTATMGARASPDAGGPADPCRFEPQRGYRRLENRLYRVEIHRGGTRAQATYKWSRDNGSLAFSIEEFVASNRVRVRRLGFDSVRSLRRDDWIEIVSDDDERAGRPGTMVRITNEPDQAERILELSGTVPSRPLTEHPVVRRWDMTPDTGLAQPRTVWTELEDGIQIRFDGDLFHTGDHWLIPARTNTADVEWPPLPRFPGELVAGAPQQLPPFGIERRRAQLAVLVHDGTRLVTAIDERRLFPAATAKTSLFQIGGDGQEPELPGAVLPQPLQVGVANGEQPVEGVLVRFTVRAGDGTLDSGGGAQSEVVVPTGADGVASVEWTLDPGEPNHRVETRLLDRCDDPTHLPVFFNARVNYSLQHLSGDGQEGRPGAQLAPLRVVVSDGRWPVRNATVRFTPAAGSGSVSPPQVATNADGVAETVWTLDSNPTRYRQHVRAELLTGPGGPLVHQAAIGFNANLSLASEVFYQPPCPPFNARNTVQDALDHHANALSLWALSGTGQEVMPGMPLQPIRVLVASRCGPVGGGGLTVRFERDGGNGTLNDGAVPVTVPVAANGTASCNWALDGTTQNQAVVATLIVPGGAGAPPTAAPTSVRFTATLSAARLVGFEPDACAARRGDEWREARTVQDALDLLCRDTGARETGRTARLPFVPLLVHTLPDLRFRDGRNHFFPHEIVEFVLPGPAVVHGGGSLWVGGMREVMRLPGEATDPTEAVRIPLDGRAFCGASDGEHVWFSLPDTNLLAAIDMRDGNVDRVPAGGVFPVALAFDGRLLWVGNFMGGSVSQLDVVTREVVRVIGLDGLVNGLAFDGEFMWIGVSRGASGILGRVHRDDDRFEPVAQLENGEIPWQLAFDGSHLWATTWSGSGDPSPDKRSGERWRSVIKLDVLDDSGTTPRRLTSFPNSHGLVFDGRHMWLLDQQAQPVIHKADVDTDQSRGAVPAGGAVFTGAYDGSHLWYTMVLEGRAQTPGVRRRLIG
jgi:hypothetical protein